MAFHSQLGSHHILLPAKGGFMAATLALAMVLNLLPWGIVTGLPDWLALVVAFWAVHEPRRMGIGSQLIRGALETARTDGLKVVARCSFVSAYLRRHPEFNDMVRAA